MEKSYFENPIVGAYFHILAEIKSNEEIDKYLNAIRDAKAKRTLLKNHRCFFYVASFLFRIQH